jgi:hypothetical protein
MAKYVTQIQAVIGFPLGQGLPAAHRLIIVGLAEATPVASYDLA